MGPAGTDSIRYGKIFQQLLPEATPLPQPCHAHSVQRSGARHRLGLSFFPVCPIAHLLGTSPHASVDAFPHSRTLCPSQSSCSHEARGFISTPAPPAHRPVLPVLPVLPVFPVPPALVARGDAVAAHCPSSWWDQDIPGCGRGCRERGTGEMPVGSWHRQPWCWSLCEAWPTPGVLVSLVRLGKKSLAIRKKNSAGTS